MSCLGYYNGRHVSLQPVCGPYSVSALTLKPFPEVMNLFRKKFNYDGRWKGRSTVSQCLNVIADLGLTWKQVNANGSLKSWTMKADPNKNYFIRVGGHFVSYKDDKIHDQSSISPVLSHWARRKRVTHAYEVSAPITKTISVCESTEVIEEPLEKVTKSLPAIAIHRLSYVKRRMCLDVETDGVDIKGDIERSISEWESNYTDYRILIDRNSNHYRQFFQDIQENQKKRFAITKNCAKLKL
jgi:hypothetical protein